MIHYEIRTRADRLLTFNGPASNPDFSPMDGDACAFESEERAQDVRERLEAMHRNTSTGTTLYHSEIVVVPTPNDLMPTVVWQVAQRMQRTALWTLALFAEDAPDHLFKLTAEVKP